MKKLMKPIFFVTVLAAMVSCISPAMNVAHADAAHPRVIRAIERLRHARAILEKAPPEFGGHKALAIQRINEAIEQLRLALAYAH